MLQDAGAGLLAAAMIAVVPGYISRSVAGSYDNEGIILSQKYVQFLKLIDTLSVYWNGFDAFKKASLGNVLEFVKYQFETYTLLFFFFFW